MGCRTKIGVKILYSNFFHGNSMPGEMPCKTSVSRFDRIFLDYKNGCRGKKSSSYGIPVFYPNSFEMNPPMPPLFSKASSIRRRWCRNGCFTYLTGVGGESMVRSPLGGKM